MQIFSLICYHLRKAGQAGCLPFIRRIQLVHNSGKWQANTPNGNLEYDSVCSIDENLLGAPGTELSNRVTGQTGDRTGTGT